MYHKTDMGIEMAAPSGSSFFGCQNPRVICEQQSAFAKKVKIKTPLKWREGAWPAGRTKNCPERRRGKDFEMRAE